MSLNRVSQVNAIRWSKWQVLLEAPNITIEREGALNPATLLPDPSEAYMLEHSCDVWAMGEDEGIKIAEQPLRNEDLILFTDGTSFINSSGERKAGWAVTTEHDIQCGGRFEVPTSAQRAELKALVEACKLAKGKTTTIYTDSRYAFGVCHDFGRLWSNRDFLTSAGTPVKNADLVSELLAALQLPKQVAVVKCKGHSREDTPEARGNKLADWTARQAALGQWEEWAIEKPLQIISVCTVNIQALRTEQLSELQAQAPRIEKWTWMERNVGLQKDGTWRCQRTGRPACPKQLMPYLAQQIHSTGHPGVSQMTRRFAQSWVGTGFTPFAADVVQRCGECQKASGAPPVRAPNLRRPAPEGPFRHWQIDYCSLPPCKGKTGLLVMVDQFSRWVEAVSVKRETAQTTAKYLVTEVIPRWGLPCRIDSDQGTHFTGKVCQVVADLLGIKWDLHCPHHPQSSGMVGGTGEPDFEG
ncbi:protein NYNRIN-like [Lepisosteus oculatus]|uniref:protein NYNRIN-like n=1 Tax=Lepisosteus oculatus TaxID=7918 RepID=UPI00371A7ABA